MIICLCRGITDRTVRLAAERGASTPGAVARVCGAGGCCGSCVSTVRAILQETSSPEEPAAVLPQQA